MVEELFPVFRSGEEELTVPVLVTYSACLSIWTVILTVAASALTMDPRAQDTVRVAEE
jgi:hypothetical protein